MDNPRWVPSNVNEPLPAGAVVGGRHSNGEVLYIARAKHKEEIIPGKVVEGQGAFVCRDWAEHRKSEYEVLVCDESAIMWVPSRNGHAPSQAIKVGYTVKNEPYYLGRAIYQGSLCLGKIQLSHRCMYIPHFNSELPIKKYEVMVLAESYLQMAEKLKWVTCKKNETLPEGALIGGRHKNGDIFYVGRAVHFEEILPGKVLGGKVALVPWGGSERVKNEYEVLVCEESSISWELGWDGQVPDNAVEVGVTVDGEILYHGRALYDGSIVLGKIHPSHKCLYIPHLNTEVSIKEYEVMVLTSNDQSKKDE